MEDVRETGRGAVGVYLMDLGDDDKVVSVAKIAKEDAEAAHEQAAALKAEKLEEREREGASGRRKKAEGETDGENGDGAAATAPQAGDKPQPLTDSLKELADRAEKDAEQRNDEDGEKGGGEGEGESLRRSSDE